MDSLLSKTFITETKKTREEFEVPDYSTLANELEELMEDLDIQTKEFLSGSSYQVPDWRGFGALLKSYILDKKYSREFKQFCYQKAMIVRQKETEVTEREFFSYSQAVEQELGKKEDVKTMEEVITEGRKRFGLPVKQGQYRDISRETFVEEIRKILVVSGFSGVQKVDFLLELNSQRLFEKSMIDVKGLNPVMSYALLRELYRSSLFDRTDLEVYLKALLFQNTNLLDYSHTSYFEPALPDMISFFWEIAEISRQKRDGFELASYVQNLELVKYTLKNELLDILAAMNDGQDPEERNAPMDAQKERRLQNWAITHIMDYFRDNSEFSDLDSLFDSLFDYLKENNVGLRNISLGRIFGALKAALAKVEIIKNQGIDYLDQDFAEYVGKLLRTCLFMDLSPTALIAKEYAFIDPKRKFTFSLEDDYKADALNRYLSGTSMAKLRNIVTGHAWEKHFKEFHLLRINTPQEFYDMVLKTVYSDSTDKRTKQKTEFENDVIKNHVFTAYINHEIAENRKGDKRKFALIVTVDDLGRDNGSVYVAPESYIDETYPRTGAKP
jgi:hypothetical protein